MGLACKNTGKHRNQPLNCYAVTAYRNPGSEHIAAHKEGRSKGAVLLGTGASKTNMPFH